MKKIVFLISLALSVFPFAFFKMENFGYQIISGNPSDKQVARVWVPSKTNGGEFVSTDHINSLFLYNKETGYTIGYGDLMDNRSVGRCIEFFKDGKELHFDEKDIKSFIFIEKQTNSLVEPREKLSVEDFHLLQENEGVPGLSNSQFLHRMYNGMIKTCLNGRYFWLVAISQPRATNLNKETTVEPALEEETNFFREVMSQIVHFNKKDQSGEWILNEDFNQGQYTTLSKDLIIDFDLLISTKQEGVEISKKGYPAHDFQEVLTHYLEHSKDDEYTLIAESIDDIVKGRTTKYTPYDLGRECRNLLIKDSQLELLKGSNILSVFGVFKNSKGESVIWGSAEDKKSKEPFHWMTRLKDKISELTHF